MEMKPCIIDNCVLFLRSIIIQMLRMKFIFLFILITKGISELVDDNYFEALSRISLKDRKTERRRELDQLRIEKSD